MTQLFIDPNSLRKLRNTIKMIPIIVQLLCVLGTLELNPPHSFIYVREEYPANS